MYSLVCTAELQHDVMTLQAASSTAEVEHELVDLCHTVRGTRRCRLLHTDRTRFLMLA